MDTIPTEILIYILSFSIPSKGQRKVRRRLARVCHFWRTVIYGNPFFWTEVRLHTTTEELREILHRNPDGPLDIIWTPSNNGKYLQCDAGMRRVAMISLQSHRWRSLVLAGPIDLGMKTQLIQIPTPRLINFTIVKSFSLILQLDLEPAVGAPLSELTLSRVSLDWEGPRLRGLRCLRLHTLGDKRPTGEQLHAMLSLSPGLEILDLACWTSLSHDSPQFKDLGAVLLPSLTALAAEEVPSTVQHMLLSCIQAPSCKYIQLPSISQDLLQDTDVLKALAKLCQGPLSTVSRLLVSYDRASGSCTITHCDTNLAPQSNPRESPLKFAKRRGVYLRTERIFGPALNDDTLEASKAGVRNFMTEVVHPASCDPSVKIQLDLHHRWPRLGDTPSNPPKSVVTDLFLSVPLATHLRIRPHFDPMDVLPFLSAYQPVRTIEGEAWQELSWPIPLMETLTVACNRIGQAAALEGLISTRGPRIQHGVATASGEADERGDDAPHPPRLLKHIVMQDKNERPYQVWDSGKGWRMC